MLLLRTIDEVRRWVGDLKQQGSKVGFVPTMGYLHEGHLSLAREARRENGAVLMSIFVNPLQFGPQEDLAAYPRDLERDRALAEAVGVDALFTPQTEEMYPSYPQLTTVQVSQITDTLCGASRPGHFTGVATVVMKLFNIVQPDRAYFGQKDYQQVQVIKTMAADLNIPVEIKMLPIIREADGLAQSSRNAYLSPREREEALCLFQSLELCRSLFHGGERNCGVLIKAMQDRISREPSAAIDYIQICDAQTLQPVEEIKQAVVVALAVKIGRTRLIDNLLLEEGSYV